MTKRPELDPRVPAIARAVADAGGRALVVGGTVRDRVLGRRAGRDVDVEVLGLAPDAVEALLGRFGPVSRFGRSYTVLHVRGLDVEITVDETAPDDFAQASRRRDLTMNSMAMDPLTGAILDPHGGREDIAARRMRATDPERFGDDPLRAVRVARFAACLEMEPDAALVALCARQDLRDVAGERILEELRRMLLEAARPARGLATLERCALLGALPELDALRGVAQDPEWHPEGDVWTHTMLVVDVAADLRAGDAADFALMLGALCHDLGKPATTTVERGRIRSLGHDRAGVAPTRALLGRLRASTALVQAVCALVEHHLAPALFVQGEAGPRGYRRLARKLDAAGVSMELLERVARADHLGRTTPDARAGVFPAGDAFLARAEALAVRHEGPADVVHGRHVIARGVAPGPAVGRILEACRAVQDETGETDPARILDRVLAAAADPA
jgi:tRNA nucleotidyltransferase (CCA-adding enzyme)